jgi:ribosomal protein S18 acetylase RimI-like enzyme
LLPKKDETTELLMRAEEAALAAWPALRELVHDGWVLRFSEGYTKRANSVNPLLPGRRPLAEKILRCEALYRANGLPTVFRLPSFLPPEIDAALAARGYETVDETLTRHMELRDFTAAPDPAILLADAPGEAWLDGFAAISGLDARQRALHHRILRQIAVPAAYAVICEGGAIAAVAIGAIWDRMVSFHSVATHPEHRRKGLGRRIMLSLLAWAKAAGAESACLQVVAANAPAIALYDGIGFTQEVSRYRYRRQTG